jgi:hypothetical protein
MKNLSIIFISLLIIIISIFSCKKTTDPIYENDPKIYAKITDTNGNPLEGVGIHYYVDYGFIGGEMATNTIMKNNKISSVDLQSFTATIQHEGNNVELNWITNSEFENSGFELWSAEIDSEYSLLDSYQSNNDLKGHGTTDEQNEYQYVDENVEANATYKYKLIDVDQSENKNVLDSLIITVFTGVIPSEYSLCQNYPNPFNTSTTISFTIPKKGHILLEIKNCWNYKTVKTLYDTVSNVGFYKISWDGKDDNGQYVTNNIYSYQLTGDDFSDQKELFLDMIEPEYIRSCNCTPLSQSDSQGKLELEYFVLPFGKTICWTDECSNEIGVLDFPNSLSLVFIKQGYKTLTKSVLIDTTQALDISVVLENE